MSFVSRLRMANMFPVSDLGSATVDMGNGDEIDNILSRVRQMNPQYNNGAPDIRQPIQSGLRQVANAGAMPNGQDPSNHLRFGGVIPSMPTPNVDGGSTEALYEKNRDAGPQITADQIMGRVGKPSRDQENYDNYLKNDNLTQDKDLARRDKESEIKKQDAETKLTNSKVGESENRIAIGALQTKGYLSPAEKIELETRKAIERDKLKAVDAVTLKQTAPAIDPNKTAATAVQQKKLDDKKAADDKLSQNKRDIIKTKTQDTLNTLGQLLDSKDVSENAQLLPEAAARVGSSNLGFRNSIYGDLPFSTKNADSSFNKLTKQSIIDLIAEMKSQSKTGATGFGAMNAKELGTLEGAANQLGDLGQSDDKIRRELVRIREHLLRVMNDDADKTNNNKFDSNLDSSGTPEESTKVRVKADNGETGTIEVGPDGKLPPGYTRIQ